MGWNRDNMNTRQSFSCDRLGKNYFKIHRFENSQIPLGQAAPSDPKSPALVDLDKKICKLY